LNPAIEGRLNRARGVALVLGIIGIALTAVGAAGNVEQFYRSYLFAYIYWAGLGLGCVSLMLLQHLVGGEWGLLIRRTLESGAKTILLLAILFLPLIFGMSKLYLWAQPAVVAHDEILQHKAMYLNPNFFIARAALYFAIWALLTFLLSKWSTEQDRTADLRIGKRMGALSAPGMILHILAVTFASIDWVMSLEPHWFSTIYGFLFVTIQAIAAMSLTILTLVMLSDSKPLAGLITPRRLQDLGTLLFAMVMFWAYLSFSQFLIIWSANLQEEIPWYLKRNFGGWGWIALFLVFFHFAVPFLLLMTRFVKHRTKLLAIVAIWMLFMTAVDLFWLIVPSFGLKSPSIHWQDVVAFAGIGGLWTALFLTQIKKQPLLPLHDARYEGLLSHAD
jgi:hypothetical protein